VRVALVGLGDIARKAYLPALAADPTLEPVLVTRNPAVREELSRAWRVRDAYENLDGALAAGIDAAFVHAATEAHPPLVSTLIHAGVPTVVDKPLAYSYDDAARVVELADRRRVGLMVGFNRRYAPMYRDVAAWPDRDVVLLHKHRRDLPDTPRQVVFDDFIHVVDTLRFLIGDGDILDVGARIERGLLSRVLLQLAEGDRRGLGFMDRDSGTTQEVLEVSAPQRRRRIVEMGEVVHHEGGVESVARRDEWTPVAVQRGFTGLCDTFLDAVRSGRRPDPDDALRTHLLCERIVTQIEANARG
jgi:virulence factor